MATVEQIIRDIQSLSPPDRARLKALLTSQFTTGNFNERFNNKQQGIHFGPLDRSGSCPTCGK